MSGDEIKIRYQTLGLSQQVLERQTSHASAMGTYVRSNCDIGDSSGLLLAAFKPLSEIAVTVAQDAAVVLGNLDFAAASAIGDTAKDFADQDNMVGETFSKLLGQLTHSGAPGSTYTDLGGPDLPAAGESAEADYGSVNSYLWEKAVDIGGAGGTAVTGAGALIDSLGEWATPGQVREVVDARSFLVPGQCPENFVQDLRWSAGVLLGSIDWVAEKLLGFSILDRCVFHPLAGDWEGIYKASECWNHAADCSTAIARNHAGLVAGTPGGWDGKAGNSFRGAMTAAAGASLGLAEAYGYVGGLVKTISTACKLACIGIGKGLNVIADILIEKAAELATPVFGWAAAAWDAYDKIQDVISTVKLIYSIIETVMSVIEDFVEAKTAIFDKLKILEDLAQGIGASATA